MYILIGRMGSIRNIVLLTLLSSKRHQVFATLVIENFDTPLTQSPQISKVFLIELKSSYICTWKLEGCLRKGRNCKSTSLWVEKKKCTDVWKSNLFEKVHVMKIEIKTTPIIFCDKTIHKTFKNGFFPLLSWTNLKLFL